MSSSSTTDASFATPKEGEETSAVVATHKASPFDYYFDSYSHYGIHMDMLKDVHRTSTYRDAMWRNAYYFQGKVVLDVGCGTGILSMFAARAGARKVIGIDCSSVASQAKQIVALNGFKDVITIIQGKVEELELDEKVDIIISEWMGYFLLYESMLNTVLYARDKWGAPGVRLFPDHANMYACGITDPQYKKQKFEVWNKVHGIDYSYFKRLSYIEPLVDTVEQGQIFTNMVRFFSFDINTVKVEDLSFRRSFALQATREELLDGICVHFDTPFKACHDVVVLDTSPYSPSTHWHQTILYLYHSLDMMAGESAHFCMTCTPNKGNPRDLDITLHVEFHGVKQECSYDQEYRLR